MGQRTAMVKVWRKELVMAFVFLDVPGFEVRRPVSRLKALVAERSRGDLLGMSGNGMP